MRFFVDDRVEFVNTNGKMDGVTGVILGRGPLIVDVDSYIVLFDRMVSFTEDRAIVMTLHCLKLVD